MRNEPLSEKLIELKEKIAKKTSEIDKSKGRLSILQDNLKKIGFKNVDQAKTRLKEIQLNLEKKEKFFKLEVKNLERSIENEDN